MPVYLQDGMVLLDSGSVATSADCCCGAGGGCFQFNFLAEHARFCFTTAIHPDCVGVEAFFQFGPVSFDCDATCSTLNLNATGTADFGLGPYNWYVNGVDNGDNTFDLFYGFSWSGTFICGEDVGTITVDFVHTGLTCGNEQAFAEDHAECEDCGDGNCSSSACPGSPCNRMWWTTDSDGSGQSIATINYVCGACCNNGVCTNTTSDLCTAAGGTFNGVGTSCDDTLGACCAFGTCFDDVEESVCTDIFGGTFQGPCTTCALNPCP